MVFGFIEFCVLIMLLVDCDWFGGLVFSGFEFGCFGVFMVGNFGVFG